MNGTWAQQLSHFYHSFGELPRLPDGIRWLHPQQNEKVRLLAKLFFEKYFNDAQPRRLLLGINPGRLGAGSTGINFTAARQLDDYCGIKHDLKKGSELSAEFIYEVIQAYGGPDLFYKNFFIGSVCPLGFIRDGKNINYYDDGELLRTVKPFIISQLKKLISFPVQSKVCICIGGEKNFKFLQALNNEHHFFEKIVPLPHPRFILQYRRKQKHLYVQQYLEVLK